MVPFGMMSNLAIGYINLSRNWQNSSGIEDGQLLSGSDLRVRYKIWFFSAFRREKNSVANTPKSMDSVVVIGMGGKLLAFPVS
jgi:hypothetical protein